MTCHGQPNSRSKDFGSAKSTITGKTCLFGRARPASAALHLLGRPASASSWLPGPKASVKFDSFSWCTASVAAFSGRTNTERPHCGTPSRKRDGPSQGSASRQVEFLARNFLHGSVFTMLLRLTSHNSPRDLSLAGGAWSCAPRCSASSGAPRRGGHARRVSGLEAVAYWNSGPTILCLFL